MPKPKPTADVDFVHRTTPTRFHESGLCEETFTLKSGKREMTFMVHAATLQVVQASPKMTARFKKAMPLLRLYREACLSANMLQDRQSRLVVKGHLDAIYAILDPE